MSNYENVLASDVLVIGAGFAGGFAAIRAKELGAGVVLVEQGMSGFSGMSTIGTHIIGIVLPDDDFDNALEGTVLESEYMVDQDYAEEALAETWDRLQEFLRIGADFRRDESGQIRWYFTDTFYPGFRQRLTCWEPMATFKHVLKVKTEAVRLGVTVLDRIMITELLISHGNVIGAFIFMRFLTISKLPFALADAIEGLFLTRYAIFALIIVIYIILGMFLDIVGAMLLTVPILYPTVLALGFDPIWYGVIMVLVMEMGIITPPVGINVFVLAGVTNTPVGTVFRGVWSFVAAMLLCIAILTIFPQIALFLPSNM